jgi:hypothetical protein
MEVRLYLFQRRLFPLEQAVRGNSEALKEGFDQLGELLAALEAVLARLAALEAAKAK